MDRYADALYLDQVKLLKLRYEAPPLSDEDLRYFEHLLDLVSRIFSSIRSSHSHSKNLFDGVGPEKPRTKHSSSGDSSVTFNNDVWALWVTKIGREIAFQGEGSLPEDKAWELLKNYQEIPLKAMVILSLVAFAIMYGKAELVDSSSSKLAGPIASLKQQTPVQDEDTAFPRWKVSLDKLLDRVLEVANRVLQMEESPPPMLAGRDTKYLNQLLLPSAVHKIVNVIFVCWKHVEDIMIKRDRWISNTPGGAWNSPRQRHEPMEELYTGLVMFDSCRWKLENKIREFNRNENKNLIKGQSSSSCWRKLRQMMKRRQL